MFVATPPPCVFFPDNFFGQPKVAKRLNVFYTNPITYLFHINESKFGVSVWVGGVFKVIGREVVKLHDSYFANN